MEGERGRGREGVTFPCVYVFSVIGKYRAVFYFPPDEVLTGARGVVNHFHGAFCKIICAVSFQQKSSKSIASVSGNLYCGIFVVFMDLR